MKLIYRIALRLSLVLLPLLALWAVLFYAAMVDEINDEADDALEARELIKGRVLENNIEYDARLAAQELAKATRSEVVQVIGTKFVLYRESHSKPREKRIQLVKPSKKRQA